METLLTAKTIKTLFNQLRASTQLKLFFFFIYDDRAI